MGLTKPRAAQIFDLDYKQAVRVITVTDIASLTGGAPNQVDGVNLSAGDRVLVAGQNTGSQNGLYYVQTVGSGSNGTWARTSDGNETGEIEAGMIVMVTEGLIYADTQWKLTTNDPIVIGVSALTFVINILSTVGGANTQVQFNDGGTLGATAQFTFNKTSNALTVGGNITGNYILGNGSQLTGIVTDFTSLTSNIIPASNVTYSLGNATNQWANIYVGGNTIFLGSLQLKDDGSNTLGVYASDGTTPAELVATSELAQYVTQNAQANITSLGTLTALGVTGNISGGNILTVGLISATGNITGDNLNISGAIADSGALTITTASGDITLNAAGNIGASTNYINNVVDPVQNQDAATKIYVDNRVSTSISYHEAVAATTTTTLASATGGTVTYAQPNGAGNGIGATLTTTGSFNLIDTANVQSANTRILVKDEANATHNGVYVWSNATVITRASTENTAGVGNVDAFGINDYFYTTSGNVNKGTAFIVDAPSGLITFGTSNIQFAVFSQSQVYSANTSAGLSLVGTVFSAKVDNNTTAFDGGGNISVQTGANLSLGTMSATGNVTGGNLVTPGAVSATGDILTGGLISATGNITCGTLVGNVTVAGAGVPTISSASNLVLSAIGNVQVTGTYLNMAGNISATGDITGGNLITTGLVSLSSITKNGSNGVGNIGSSTNTFNTVFAKATSAQYADLAEMYVADKDYAPGTVVDFGGNFEITISTQSHSTAVAGIVSTNPSYLMNSAQSGKHVLAIALTGRVPCQVQGPVRKGDVLVSSNIPGVAQRIGMNWQPGCVLGKAMEAIESVEVQTIEVAVGRF
jgi:hypothetical protein